MATIGASVENLNILEPMSQNLKTFKSQNKPKQLGVYNQAILTKKIIIPITSVGKNIRNILEKVITSKYEGRCDIDGYIKIGSSRIITYSSGILKGSDIIFETVFECLVCYPVEGMLIQCLVKNVTKAGIRAEIPEGPDEISPVVIFIARDHHLSSTYFSSVQPGQSVQVRVIGSRFELNDKYVSVIAELIEPKPLFTKKNSLSEIQSSKPVTAIKTVKATMKGKQVKPLSTIVSQEEAGPLEAQELTISAPEAEKEVTLQQLEKTAQVEEPLPSFKPLEINLPAKQEEEIVEAIAPSELPKPIIEPAVAEVTSEDIKKVLKPRKKLIIKSKITS